MHFFSYRLRSTCLGLRVILAASTYYFYAYGAYYLLTVPNLDSLLTC